MEEYIRQRDYIRCPPESKLIGTLHTSSVQKMKKTVSDKEINVVSGEVQDLYWVPDDKMLNNPDLQLSKFGDLKKNEDVLDKEVRFAYEIAAEDIDVEAAGFTPEYINLIYDDTITKKIIKYLYPGKNIKFRLNKVNIYTEGGHFKEHVDTPVKTI